MPETELLGLIAGTLTTLAFLPQVIKTWKSRSAQDISLGMFLLFSAYYRRRDLKAHPHFSRPAAEAVTE